MSASVFEDKANIPDDKMLAKALGKTNRLWQEIKKNLKAEYGELNEDWKHNCHCDQQVQPIHSFSCNGRHRSRIVSDAGLTTPTPSRREPWPRESTARSPDRTHFRAALASLLP